MVSCSTFVLCHCIVNRRRAQEQREEFEGVMLEGSVHESQEAKSVHYTKSGFETSVNERQLQEPDTIPTLDTAKREEVERNGGVPTVGLTKGEEDSGLPSSSSKEVESVQTSISTSGIATGTHSQQMRRNTNKESDMDDLPVMTNKKET